MVNNGYYIPHLQVRSNAVLIYDRYIGNRSKVLNTRRRQIMQQQRSHAYSGKLSAGARKRLSKAVTLLAQSAKPQRLQNPITGKYFTHRLSFITLTVSDHTKLLDGKTAYKLLLSHFLQWLRRTKKVKSYVWKAELQQNGQIHYHITSPACIPWKEVRDKWNTLQKAAGLLDAYEMEHGHTNANSTDIHEVEALNDLAGYILKEVCKQVQNTKALGGKVWDCSKNLKEASYFTVEMQGFHERFIELSVREGLASTFTGDHFTIVKFKEPVAETLLTKHELKQFRNFCTAVRECERWEFQPPPLNKI